MAGWALLGLSAAALVAMVPWDSLPRDADALRNVGVPQQYRELMNHNRPQTQETPTPVVESDDPLVSLTPLRPRPAEPAPLAAVETAPAKPPAPTTSAPAPVKTAPSQPKALLYAARTAPPESGQTPAAPAHASVASSPRFRVQIAATGADEEAEAVWRDIRREFPEETQDRNLAITPAIVNGRKVRRAIVGGFPSAEAARSFCARLAAANRGCLLRGRN